MTYSLATTGIGVIIYGAVGAVAITAGTLVKLGARRRSRRGK